MLSTDEVPGTNLDTESLIRDHRAHWRTWVAGCDVAACPILRPVKKRCSRAGDRGGVLVLPGTHERCGPPPAPGVGGPQSHSERGMNACAELRWNFPEDTTLWRKVVSPIHIYREQDHSFPYGCLIFTVYVVA